MPLHTSSHQKLLETIDGVVAKHGSANKELKKDLLALRTQLDAALRTKRWFEVAQLSLRVASLVKFFFDHLPPS